MLAVGGLLIYAAYTFGGYGYVLVRGWDIPFRGWVSPLNPYRWPSGGPQLIPDTQIFPSGGATGPPSNVGTGTSTSGTLSPAQIGSSIASGLQQGLFP